MKALSSRFSVADCSAAEETRLSGERVITRVDSFQSTSPSSPLGRTSPNPWDLSLLRQNGSLASGAAAAAPSHSGRRVDAPVASLRCRIPRSGDVSINLHDAHFRKKYLPRLPFARYKYSCPGSAPLAGFEVSAYGRFSDVHRGQEKTVQQAYQEALANWLDSEAAESPAATWKGQTRMTSVCLSRDLNESFKRAVFLRDK